MDHRSTLDRRVSIAIRRLPFTTGLSGHDFVIAGKKSFVRICRWRPMVLARADPKRTEDEEMRSLACELFRQVSSL